MYCNHLPISDLYPFYFLSRNRSFSVIRPLLFISDIDDCAGGPCDNGGTCTDGVNGYTCACVTGFTGPDCETSTYSLFNHNITLDNQQIKSNFLLGAIPVTYIHGKVLVQLILDIFDSS